MNPKPNFFHMKIKTFLTCIFVLMVSVLTPAFAIGSGTNSPLFNVAYEWVLENRLLAVTILVSALLLILLVTAIIRWRSNRNDVIEEPVQVESKPAKKNKKVVQAIAEPEPVAIIKEVVVPVPEPLPVSSLVAENNLGASIVKAAWILGVSVVLSVVLLLVSHQYRSNRYAPLEKLTYIDTWTGKCYYSDGRPIE
jgi:hypothetical protein